MFCWPGDHFTKGGILLPGDATRIPLNWKLRPPPSHFGLHIPLTQDSKKGDTVLAGVIVLDYQGEIGHHDGG